MLGHIAYQKLHMYSGASPPDSQKIWISIGWIERFIYALGIRHIGLENAKLISKHLRMSKNFYDLSLENRIDDLLNLDGIGETQINSIRNFFSNKTNRKVLNELKNINKVKWKMINIT